MKEEGVTVCYVAVGLDSLHFFMNLFFHFFILDERYLQSRKRDTSYKYFNVGVSMSSAFVTAVKDKLILPFCESIFR